jgi:hypothetical protein
VPLGIYMQVGIIWRFTMGPAVEEACRDALDADDGPGENWRRRRIRDAVDRIFTDLFHMRALLAALNSDEDLPEGLSRKRTDLFGVIPPRIDFLHETASNLREGFASQIGLHINDQSYEMNSVMKVIAFIAAIALVPTLVGQMLGMNLLDSPWPYYLWQVPILTLAAMLAIACLFRQLGWMR